MAASQLKGDGDRPDRQPSPESEEVMVFDSEAVGGGLSIYLNIYGKRRRSVGLHRDWIDFIVKLCSSY